MQKRVFIVFLLLLCMLFSIVYVFAAPATTKIFIENLNVGENTEIVVPVKIENNTGICGATVSISYDSALVLTGISSGDAFSSLVMTRPGNLAANPFKIVFDGIEEDRTNGTIAYLHFNGVSNAGVYNISVAYEPGDIVNGNLESLDIQTVNGKIKVGSDAGGEEPEKPVMPVFTIGNVMANPGESVNVPVYLSGNMGICGATLKIAYDARLTLTQITKGDALSNLIMTKPGNLSANPFNLVFDGIEEDSSNGLVFTLTFTAPRDNGTYSITASYAEGDIVNGALIPVDVQIEKGGIMVGSKNITVEVGNQVVYVPVASEAKGNIYVAFYKSGEMMTHTNVYDFTDSKITVVPDLNTAYVKVFCWSDCFNPLYKIQTIMLN